MMLDSRFFEEMGLPPDRAKAVQQRTYQRYVEAMPMHCQALSDAYHRGDHEVVREKAHFLKSGSASVGAELLAKQLADIEVAAATAQIALIETLLPEMEQEFERTIAFMNAFLQSGGGDT